jgi:dTMP kinase
VDFHDRVRAGFRSLAESDPNRYLVLDASRPLEELAAVISARVLAVLPRSSPGPVGRNAGTAAGNDGPARLQRGSQDVAEAPK